MQRRQSAFHFFTVASDLKQMKTPQRRFVVEFKTGRRKARAQTNSIWGDTDLKALTREVEDTTWHLFNSKEAPGAPDSGGATRVVPINAACVNEATDSVATPFANGAEIEVSKHQQADHPAEADVQVQESQPAWQPRTTSSGTPRKRVPDKTLAHNSKLGNEVREARIGTIGNPISLDELAALSADNKRLKGLLAEQLCAQNVWLKKMLERFNAE